MEQAEWIEDRAEEYRADKRRDVYRLATVDLYRQCVAVERQRVDGDFDKFEKRMKKAREERRLKEKASQRVKDYRSTHPYLRPRKATP
jgi:hypothetical protein